MSSAATDPAWNDVVVICATTYWSGTRLLDQHIAEALTEYAPVLYVDPPTSVLSRFRNHEARVAAGPPGLTVLRPRLALLRPRVLPLKERPIGKQIALASVRRAVREATRTLGATRVQALIVPSLNPMFGTADERVSVFYAKDDYLAGAGLMGIRQRRLRTRAVRQPRDADVVVAVSPVLVDRYRELGIDAVLIPNGCDVDHFATVSAPPSRPVPPVVGFVGHVSDRIDFDLLDAVASAGHELRIIGSRQETLRRVDRFEALTARPNVTWSGPVPYADLADELAGLTTCLLPYDNDSRFNRASFPLKVLEYLAAGRRVVATGLPAVQWLDTDLISVANTAGDFAAAVTESLRSPLGADEVARRRAFAAGHTWRERTRLLADALQLGSPRPQLPVGSA
jgi:teichuronic acid biosynthesis glycosyltransferase TuaH